MTLILALLLAPFTLLTLCFAIELAAGLRPFPLRELTAAVTCDVVIVVPAHDEEAILGAKLASLTAAAVSHARILLVADNCADSTAEIARLAGVEVIERFDEARRGKGFALDFARRHLETRPPEVVLIMDADCVMDAKSIARLSAECAVRGAPCQATNLQVARADASAAVQLSTFAFYIKNVIRQRALQRLAGRVHLLGTGMAFPWPIFAGADLATGSIVEDLKLGQELAEAGHAPLFVESAIVLSDAETERETLSQRRRWEGGYIDTAARIALGMLVKAGMRGDAQGLWAALSLMIPPLALLVLLDVAGLAIAAAVWVFGIARPWPFITLAAALLLAGFGLAAAWACGGRRFAGLGAVVRMPLYVLWKLPLYLGLVRRGTPKEWLRTRRG